MGDQSGIRGAAKSGSGPSGHEALGPGTPLLAVEAAALAGVSLEVIEDQMADGSLLFETTKRKGREVPLVRLMDLADVYPSVMGRPDPAPDPDPEPVPQQAATPAPSTSTQPETQGGAPDGLAGADLAQAVRASGADRDALISLAQDLEVRLDLAERERQASTASLLMAQRRILDLERDGRRRPLATMVAAALGLSSLGLFFAAWKLPSVVEAAARDEVRTATEQASVGLEKELRGLLEEEHRAALETMERSVERSVGGSVQSAMDSLALTMNETLRTEARARDAQQLGALESQLAAVRQLMAREADERSQALEALAQDAQDQRTRQAAEFMGRLNAAEALAKEAREALTLERAASAGDREAFRLELDALLTSLQEMASSLPESGAQPGDTAEKKEPAPWWKRALVKD